MGTCNFPSLVPCSSSSFSLSPHFLSSHYFPSCPGHSQTVQPLAPNAGLYNFHTAASAGPTRVPALGGKTCLCCCCSVSVSVPPTPTPLALPILKKSLLGLLCTSNRGSKGGECFSADPLSEPEQSACVVGDVCTITVYSGQSQPCRNTSYTHG